ncbi:MAG: hypothetical protein ACD_62C00281G0006 [uncultured bacterium]|nr:MAG: hypothetical protein ACD_62C00281G0006 [uncultured bacterium]
MFRLINRCRALYATSLSGKSHFIIHRNVDISIHKKAKITIEHDSLLKIGYPLPNGTPRPTYKRSVLVLDENAQLVVRGDVFIADGFFIKIGKNGKLIFEGGNWLAHNATIICNDEMYFGRHASISWNVTLIDDDRRSFYTVDMKPVSKKRHPLILGACAGIQMNVVIPKGVTVGKNSLVGANTVLRQDVANNCLVYQNPEIRIKNNVTTGLQNLL